MKQTITELEIRTVHEDIIIEVTHGKTTINIGRKEGEERWVFFDIPAEFCDSLIEMLQKRKELMG
jgi:hypothetical protein